MPGIGSDRLRLIPGICGSVKLGKLGSDGKLGNGNDGIGTLRLSEKPGICGSVNVGSDGRLGRARDAQDRAL